MIRRISLGFDSNAVPACDESFIVSNLSALLGDNKTELQHVQLRYKDLFWMNSEEGFIGFFSLFFTKIITKTKLYV